MADLGEVDRFRLAWGGLGWLGWLGEAWGGWGCAGYWLELHILDLYVTVLPAVVAFARGVVDKDSPKQYLVGILRLLW